MTFLPSVSGAEQSKYPPVQLWLERAESGFVAQTYLIGNNKEVI